MQPIFTIGHSLHPFLDFVALLQQQQIGYLLDVRSAPYSRHAPQFNKERLTTELLTLGIKYAYLGKGLGARRTEPHLLDAMGRVTFSKVRETREFCTAVARIERGATQGYRVALMCSEGNPFDCHRFALVAYQLARDGYEVIHIMRDGRLKTQAVLEDELLDRYADRIPHPTIFEPNISRVDQLEAAYQLRNLDIGWLDDRIEASA